MKKMMLLPLLLTSLLLGEGEYGLNWANYDYMNQDDVTRSAVWNPATDHVLLSTRMGYPRIVILDAETGNYLGEMDTSGLGARGAAEEGLGLLAISDDGYIYACNLGHDLYGWNFTVWRFDDENATAEIVFDEMVDTDQSSGYEWWGASLAVVGSGTDTYLFTSGWQNDAILVLKMGPRNYFEVHDVIPAPSWNSARHGISPVTPQGPFWINGAGDTTPPVRLIGREGEIYAQAPDSLISAGGTSGVLHWQVGNIKVVTAINGFLNSTLRSARYSEDELGTISFDYLGGNSDSLMLAYQGATLYMNLNCSGTMNYDPTRHALYTVMGNNSVASVDLNPLINVRTPRDAGFLAVRIDGKNKEYTHYDYLGMSSDRDLYLTWDENALYFAMSGSSLFDAY
ncbi:MAG TPA: hypothetical protein ENN84_05595, partial [Candidatus Marinimicrobia bacterium]|nr:hypothetical protein [Candidatus Neomarinimicrobiota bacterium]